MQIIASTQNENVLNLATSGSKSADSKQNGIDFSYIFNLMNSKDTQCVKSASRNSVKRNDNNNNKEFAVLQKSDKNFVKRENTSFTKKDCVKTDSVNSNVRKDTDNTASNKVSDDPYSKDTDALKSTDNNNENTKQQYVLNDYDEGTNDVFTDIKNFKTLSPSLADNGLENTVKADFEGAFDKLNLSKDNKNSAFNSFNNSSLDQFSDNTELDAFADSVLDLNKDILFDAKTLDSIKGSVASKNANSQDTQLTSMMLDLNVESVTITDNDPSLSLSEDEFGAKTFETIEESIQSAIELSNESLDSTDNKELIKDIEIESEKLAESASENADSEFSKSLNVLKAAVLKNSENSETQNEEFVFNAETNNNSKRVNVESAFMFKASKAKDSIKSIDTGAKDNSSGFNNAHQGLNAFAKAMNAKSASSSNAANSQFTTLFMSSNLKENAQKITEQVMKMASRNLKTMNIELSPNSLGKLKISLDMSKSDEIASVTISASDKATKALVEQGLSDLKDKLLANDIKADPKVEEYKEQENSGHKEHSGKDGNSEENSKQFAANEDNSLFDEDNLSFENLINSQNKDLMSKFA